MKYKTPSASESTSSRSKVERTLRKLTSPFLEEILNLEGAPQAHQTIHQSLEDVRKQEPMEAVTQISSLALLEQTKKQVRAARDQFTDFLRSLPPKELTAPFPQLVTWWLQAYLRTHLRVKRVTTLWQKARSLQSAFPKLSFLRSPELSLYMRGLGKIQLINNRNLPVASFDQSTELENRA